MHEATELDPLVRMAIGHYQFEAIHPFTDGNGRTGRVLNSLFLIEQDLLTLPILYLRRYINNHRGDYYRLLLGVTSAADWEAWILYMLRGVALTSRSAITLVKAFRDLMQKTKHDLRAQLPKIYSQDLLNNLFRHPYTRIQFIRDDLSVTRQTAAEYLEQLVEKGFLEKHKSGRSNYYINTALVALFLQVSEGP